MSFSLLQDKDFIDRQEELDNLSRRVLQSEKGIARSAVLCGPPGIGKTELLKHLYGRLFWKQNRVAPFYYAVKPALVSAAAFSKTYLAQFICQRIAFQKKDQSLLYRDGISLDGLSALAEDHEAAWAREIIDQYAQSSHESMDALRIALAAPHRSMLATGISVAVLIDDFHRLRSVDISAQPVSLFEEPASHGRTPHVITGNMAELLEMPVTGVLDRIALQPLSANGASSKVLAVLSSHDAEGSAPPLLLRHLGGNPFYLDCVVVRACAKSNPGDKDFWNAYVQEVLDGPISHSWSATLKGFFSNLQLRRVALALLYKIYHTAEPYSCQKIAKSFSLTEGQASEIPNALYLAGFIRGEFGVFRPVEDRVVRDIIDCLYMREILAKSPHDLERDFLERLIPQKGHGVRFELALPMATESELVAAQCLEQIGKNLHLNQDAIGQLQVAVIEACINAMEHSRGTEKTVYVSVAVDEDTLEVSVESAGQEFIIQETGEPFSERESAKAANRGWGIKLMKQFTDRINFEKTARGTKIVLTKKLEKTADIQKEDKANRE